MTKKAGLLILAYASASQTLLPEATKLKQFLIKVGLWDDTYLAFPLKVKGNETESDLEMLLAGVKNVSCDILGTGELKNCDTRSLQDGHYAIVIYDKTRLETSESEKLRRPNGKKPSHYVTAVIMPPVQ